MCILAVNIPSAHNVNISHHFQDYVSFKFVVFNLRTRSAKVGIINISPTLNKILNINNYNLGTRFYTNVIFKTFWKTSTAAIGQLTLKKSWLLNEQAGKVWALGEPSSIWMINLP